MPVASSRIPVQHETQERLRDFSSGLSATYDEAINFLLDILNDDEVLDYLMSTLPEGDITAIQLGTHLREKYRKLQSSK